MTLVGDASRVAVDERSFTTAAGDFDEWNYLFHNPDVAQAVRDGRLSSGYQHFCNYGLSEYQSERRAAPRSTREISYLLRNPDVKQMVRGGEYASGYHHWLEKGREEEEAGKRRPYLSGATEDVSEFDLRTWRDGYVILPSLFSPEQCDGIVEVTERLWSERDTVSQPIDVDIFLNLPQERKVHIADAPEAAFDHPFKINNLYFWNQQVRDTILDRRLAGVIRHLIDGDPVALTSLNFRKGSEQGLHLDTFYMPPVIPHRMVAAWVALEDVTEENGPLRYVPGSNRIPPYYFDGHRLSVNHSKEEYDRFGEYFEGKLNDHQLQEQRLLARKGDVFIWHALLFHGGSPINAPKSTRNSVVAHYFAAADYPGGSCTGAKSIIEYGWGRYYEDRPPSVPPRPAPAQLSFLGERA